MSGSAPVSRDQCFRCQGMVARDPGAQQGWEEEGGATSPARQRSLSS